MRYLRLYWNFFRFSFGKASEFRFDFFTRIIMDIIFYIINIAFFNIIYLHTDNLAGWNKAQMMVFVSGYIIIDALYMVLMSATLLWLSKFINRGDLDYYLT